MKKWIVIGIIVFIFIGYFLVSTWGDVVREDNMTARQNPKATVEKVISFYKGSGAFDKQFMYKFHTENFEQLVTDKQLYTYWTDVLRLTPESNLGVELVSETENAAVVKMTNRDTGEEVMIYLTKTEKSPDLDDIWGIQSYSVNGKTLGNPPQTQN